MGLFDSGKKRKIKSIVQKISTGLAQIEEEQHSSGQQVTPMVRGILIALKHEVSELESLIKINGRTDWGLLNTLTVQLHGGQEMLLADFVSRLYTRALGLEVVTGIDIRIWF